MTFATLKTKLMRIPSTKISMTVTNCREQMILNPYSWIATQQSNFATATRKKAIKVNKNKKSKKGKDDSGGAIDPNTEILIRCLDAPKRPKEIVSEEEAARRYEVGRNHVIGAFNQHNMQNHQLVCKMKLKKHAIKLLPKDTTWKEEALKIDMSEDALPPLWRDIPMDFPAPPNFNVKDYEDDENK